MSWTDNLVKAADGVSKVICCTACPSTINHFDRSMNSSNKTIYFLISWHSITECVYCLIFKHKHRYGRIQHSPATNTGFILFQPGLEEACITACVCVCAVFSYLAGWCCHSNTLHNHNDDTKDVLCLEPRQRKAITYRTKSSGPGIRMPQNSIFKPAVWPCSSHLTFLGFSFFTSQVGIIPVYFREW